VAVSAVTPLDVDARDARGPPRPLVFAGIGLAGLLVAACFIAFGLRHEVSEIQIALLAWISLPFIAAGVVAWWRRPVLFVHATPGQGGETLTEDFHEAAKGPKEYWAAPGGHTGAIDAAPEEYERRVVGFFDRYLRPGT
jgi:hypothetical protein